MAKTRIKVRDKVYEGVMSSGQIHGKNIRGKIKDFREDKVEINLSTIEALDLKKLSAFFVGPLDKKNREATLKLGIKMLMLVMEAHKRGLLVSFTRNNNIHKTIGFIKGSIFVEEGV